MSHYIRICKFKISRLGILRIHIEQANSRVGTSDILEWRVCWGSFLGCDYSREHPSLQQGLEAPGGRDGRADQWGQQCPRLRALLASPGKEQGIKAFSEPWWCWWLSWGKSTKMFISASSAGWRLRIHHCVQVEKAERTNSKFILSTVHTTLIVFFANTTSCICSSNESVLKSLFSRTYFFLCFQNILTYYFDESIFTISKHRTKPHHNQNFRKALCCSLVGWSHFCISIHLLKIHSNIVTNLVCSTEEVFYVQASLYNHRS